MALSVIIGLLILVGILYIVRPDLFGRKPTSGPVACSQEAKVCPDGSTVGRIGENCEFAACPPVTTVEDPATAGWLTTTDTASHLTFKYPEKLSTTYIDAFTWPPKIQVLDQPFVCVEGGADQGRASTTQKATVDTRSYCVTGFIGAAAGNIYTDYSYAFPKGNKTIILSFTIHAVQCANYDDPQKTACERERSSFDLNAIVDHMARSIKS